jgi:hypothetical protein
MLGGYGSIAHPKFVVAKCCHGGATLQTFVFWDKLSEYKHSDTVVFQFSGQNLLLSPYEEICKNNTFVIKKLQP